MNRRGWAALAILALLAFGMAKSRAEEQPHINIRHQSPGATTCTVVREFVALVGPERAEQMAREAGASEARIVAGRKCLK